ncbi:uncharacterized protein LOC125435814 isoform X1 [Sphaerodactylus townsendi]|uniref:uncharacterized protein LOC125435814 isoform X1 n=1 Tax=Sphaerodactylus townsendi TaxID=933632 RepID=UPI0020274260|nr:uncharacterized protein LOC125435814 isoform X1 [Sphaerodactylus townsendi]
MHPERPGGEEEEEAPASPRGLAGHGEAPFPQAVPPSDPLRRSHPPPPPNQPLHLGRLQWGRGRGSTVEHLLGMWKVSGPNPGVCSEKDQYPHHH